MLSAIEKTIRNFQTATAFNGQWFGIFLNPFYITRRQLFLAVKEFAQIVNEKDSVLDIGCGTQPYRSFFKAGNYTGIDVKGGGLKDVTKKVDKYFNGLTIPYPNKKFSVVIATEVLEHAVSPEKLYTEMVRVLKPAGKIFITMPFVWPVHGSPYDFQRYTAFKHQKLLLENKLEPVYIRQTTGVFGTCGQIVSDFLYGELVGRVFKTKMRYGLQFVLANLIVLGVSFPIQLVFSMLDEVFAHKGITLDYIVYAKKK